MRSQARRANLICCPRPNSRNPNRTSRLGMRAGRDTTWMRNSTDPSSSHFHTA
jgi:hypothetical protein